MKIKYNPVESSNIVGEFYDEEKQMLYIKFKNQREYCYKNVSPEEFKDLKEAESFGKFLYAFIVNKKEFEEIW